MMKLVVPEYEDNKEEYRDFIIRHKDYIEYDDIRNSDALLRYALEGKNIDINYGEFCEMEEVVYHVLVEEYHIDCEYVPRGYSEIGIGEPGQTDNIILVDERYRDNKVIQGVLTGKLV